MTAPEPSMRTGIRSRLFRSVRAAGDDHRVTQFELFFDLVFVFAFTQVTLLMAHAHSALSVVQGLTILGMLWWIWCSYSWLANQAQADKGVLRAGLAVATGLMFIVAVTIPDAFSHDEGPNPAAFLLIACYFAVRAVHASLYILAAQGDRSLERQVLRTTLLAAGPSAILLCLGAWIGGDLQTWIWLVAWVLDAVILFLTSRNGAWQLHSAAHWADRYGLVVILAIGESIVAIGVGLRDIELSVASVFGALMAIGGAVILWWLYFHSLAAGAEHALARRTGMRKVEDATIAYTYLHYLVIAGVIVTALGIETVMTHISDPEPLGWFGAFALAGGVALYQATTVFIWYRMTGRWLVARLVASTVLLPGIALAAALPPMAALGAAVAAGVVLLVIEWRTRAFSLGDDAKATAALPTG
jgi:low temperature requirement protein LtrA